MQQTGNYQINYILELKNSDPAVANELYRLNVLQKAVQSQVQVKPELKLTPKKTKAKRRKKK
jgi:hypothetical protein